MTRKAKPGAVPPPDAAGAFTQLGDEPTFTPFPPYSNTLPMDTGADVDFGVPAGGTVFTSNRNEERELAEPPNKKHREGGEAGRGRGDGRGRGGRGGRGRGRGRGRGAGDGGNISATSPQSANPQQ